ncbi:MAG: glycosyltransferase family 2 protein [Chloroflexi bacterium]|nr:MAG: glycosyltransferase family 2 protein [Chloroflexota bacterium]
MSRDDVVQAMRMGNGGRGMEDSKRGRYPCISVVIPALNEAENLPYVLPAVANIGAEVILVDGHSDDETTSVARHLMPDVKIVEQLGRGKGNALRCGLAECTGDIIVLMDADGSTDPHEIPRFVDALLAGADIAKGSRFLDNGRTDDITRLRRFGNRMLNEVVNQLFQTPFTDLCYGYIALWRGCLDFFDVDCDGFEVETQINLRARKANLKIVEVPSYEHLRLHGASHLNTFRDGWRVLRMIGQEWMSRYSTIKTPGTHRHSYNLAVVSDLTTLGISPELSPSSSVEHAIAVSESIYAR